MEKKIQEALREAPLRLDLADAAKAGIALNLRPTGKDLSVLFIQRAEHPSDPWSGQIGFPGGRREPQDENLWETAKRETFEEVGLKLQDQKLLGELNEVQARAKMKTLPLVLHPFVHFQAEDFSPRLSEEVEKTFWVPLTDLANPKFRKSFEIPRENETWIMPSIDILDVRIWGLSLVVLQDLLNRLSLVGIVPPPDPLKYQKTR